MYDGNKIIIGLVIFGLLIISPILYNTIGKASVPPEPDINTPEINKMIEKKCVEPKSFMRANHMQILNDWRDEVVRVGKTRTYVNGEGKEFNMSLQNTCMKCHSNKKNFCDKCHTYMAVKPYCWDCHIAPKEKTT
jgi:hypothetical protein